MVIRALPGRLARDAFERTLARDGFDPPSAFFEWVGYRTFGGTGVDGRGTARRTRARSIAYVACKTTEIAKRVRDRYHGATFRVRARDSEGRVIEGEDGVEETRATVERAPSQWTPRTFGERYASTSGETNAVNALEGTIESDAEYLKFVSELENERTRTRTTGAVAPKQESARRKSTALLEYIWKKRAVEERANKRAANGGKGASKTKKTKQRGDADAGENKSGKQRLDAAPKRRNKQKSKKSSQANGTAAAPVAPGGKKTARTDDKRIPVPKASLER